MIASNKSSKKSYNKLVYWRLAFSSRKTNKILAGFVNNNNYNKNK